MSSVPRNRTAPRVAPSPTVGGRRGEPGHHAGCRTGVPTVRRRTHAVALLLAALLVLAACGGGGGSSAGPAAPTGPPQRGGEITVLEDSAFAGGWPTGLDPATNTTGGANLSQM